MAKSCCKKFHKGKKPCRDCPKMAELDKRQRRKLLKKYRKKK